MVKTLVLELVGVAALFGVSVKPERPAPVVV